MNDPILILPTGMTLPAETKKLMKAKGIIVLYMDDPSQAVVLHLTPNVHADAVTQCALMTVRANPHDAPSYFGKLMLKSVLEEKALHGPALSAWNQTNASRSRELHTALAALTTDQERAG